MNSIEQKCTKNTEVIKPKFVCDICDYKCSDSSNYKKHISTKKHKSRLFEQPVNTVDQTATKSTDYQCKNCSKAYKNRNGLWYHKQKCVKEKVNIYNKEDISLLINENKDFKNIILDLVKSNTDFQ